jgi:hypothetical protein
MADQVLIKKTYLQRDVTQLYESRHPALKSPSFKLPRRASKALKALQGHALWIFFTLAGMGVLAFIGRTAYWQYRALAQWKAVVPEIDGAIENSDPRMHTPAFWRVMGAFGLEQGDPVEDFIDVFGKPDRVEPVRWYCYVTQAPNGKDAPSHTWVCRPLNAFAMDGYVQTLDARHYTWKYDHYHWPRPKGW